MFKRRYLGGVGGNFMGFLLWSDLSGLGRMGVGLTCCKRVCTLSFLEKKGRKFIVNSKSGESRYNCHKKGNFMIITKLPSELSLV